MYNVNYNKCIKASLSQNVTKSLKYMHTTFVFISAPTHVRIVQA